MFSTSAIALEKITPSNSSEANSSDSPDLTDEERFESTVFVHEGLSQRQMLEACEKLKDPAACRGQGKTKFLGVDSTLVQGIARAYSMFSGMIGASGALSGSSGSGEGSGVDYCGIIPMAGEQVASFMQQAEQTQIESQPVTKANPQKEQLYQASRSHGARARSSKIQGSVWGITTGCYGAMVATGKAALDKKTILKAGAAGFLTLFWLNESKQQKKYESEVKSIADSLPGAGDCNPHTERNCYCAQPETEFAPKYCLEALRSRDPSKISYEVPCTTENNENDPKCYCIGLDNCLDKKAFSNMKLPGISSFAASSAGSEARNLFRGTLSSADLSSDSSKNSARAKGIFKSILPSLDKDLPLSEKQLSISDSIASLGVPQAVARSLAATNPDSFGNSKAAGLSLSTGAKPSAATKKSTRAESNVLRFNKSKNSIRNQKKKSGNSSLSQYMNKLKRGTKGKKSSGSKILKFSRQAERSAEISQKKDKPIFEIISRRYKLSAGRRLSLD